MPLTADAFFYIDSNPHKFSNSGTKIYCNIDLNKDDVALIAIGVWNTAGDTLYGSASISKTKSEIESYSSGESGEVAIYRNCVEKAVKDYLDGITGNSGVVTFTIV